MIDPNIIRYCNASINKYFTDSAQTGNYPLYIEGQDLSIIDNQQAWCELHISIGPTIEESSNSSMITVTITLMCSSLPDATDMYVIHKIAGFFANAASQGFNVLDENSNVIGCFYPKNPCRIQQWGFIQQEGKVSQVQQTHVEAEYQLDL